MSRITSAIGVPDWASVVGSLTAAVTTTGTTLHPRRGRPQELRDAEGSTFTRGSLMAEVEIPRNPPLTLYAMLGDWGVIVLAILGIGAGLLRGAGKEEVVEEAATGG